MRRILVLLFLFVFVQCNAQKKVSKEFAAYKLRMDSLMRVTYGDTLFEQYFVFDENSYVWVDNDKTRKWNQRYWGDSVTSLEFWYVFKYPGAGISPVDGYRPGSTIMWLFEDSLKYYGRCINVSPDTVASITKTKFGRPLKDCYVTLYTDDFFSTDSSFARLDSSHIYLTVEYRVYEGTGKWGSKYKAGHYTLLIDACTGQYIGKQETYNEGTVGAHF